VKYGIMSVVRAAAELRDRELLPDIGAEKDLRDAFSSGFDRDFLEHALATIEGKEIDPPPAFTTLAYADEKFLSGDIEDSSVESAAHGAYGYVLLADPHSAHAAFQLAWIDRAFGSPITNERVAWIRALGFADPKLLETLATPIVPLPGWHKHPHHHDNEEDLQSLAGHAERVGLPSIAALYWKLLQRDDEHTRTLSLAEAHVVRVQAAITA
jgi:hypothetical protein